MGTDSDNGNLHGLTLSNIEVLDSQAYNTIKAEIGNMPLELPPSSTMGWYLC